MSTVVTVLRSGGDFEPYHVQALQEQVYRWSPPGTQFKCLSDVFVSGVECIPLKYYWPGWWAKMELFRPDLLGDCFFTDLDNVIVGPLDDILNTHGILLNSGVNGSMWTSFMRLPATERHHVWDLFIQDPLTLMQFYDSPMKRPPFGDAAIVSMCLRKKAARWEDALPGQVVNISTMQTPFGFRKPPGARVILTHRPYRPWSLSMFQSLYGEQP